MTFDSTLCATRHEMLLLGEKMAAEFPPNSVILLSGDLGSGKTTWVKGFAHGLGFAGEATSPTFALVHEYNCGTSALHHWDLYRLNASTDWNVLELEDHLASGQYVVVEWPEHFTGKWPVDAIHLKFEDIGNDQHQVTRQK